nr:hypothetical protein [Tanacetum cinerariifolium]
GETNLVPKFPNSEAKYSWSEDQGVKLGGQGLLGVVEKGWWRCGYQRGDEGVCLLGVQDGDKVVMKVLGCCSRKVVMW